MAKNTTTINKSNPLKEAQPILPTLVNQIKNLQWMLFSHMPDWWPLHCEPDDERHSAPDMFNGGVTLETVYIRAVYVLDNLTTPRGTILHWPNNIYTIWGTCDDSWTTMTVNDGRQWCYRRRGEWIHAPTTTVTIQTFVEGVSVVRCVSSIQNRPILCELFSDEPKPPEEHHYLANIPCMNNKGLISSLWMSLNTRPWDLNPQLE